MNYLCTLHDFTRLNNDGGNSSAILLSAILPIHRLDTALLYKKKKNLERVESHLQSLE